jgi:hypothetical protein
MVCNDPRHSDEERARAALEEMDDKSVALMRKLMEKRAKSFPRFPKPELVKKEMPEKK